MIHRGCLVLLKAFSVQWLLHISNNCEWGAKWLLGSIKWKGFCGQRKALSHHLNAAQLWKQSFLPWLPPTNSFPAIQNLSPPPPLPPFPFTETSFPKGSTIVKFGGHFSGLLTGLSGACDTADHPALGTLSSLGCPGPCCPAPSAMAADSLLPPLFIFLQSPLICCHYPGVSVCSGCYNRAP